jgi:hypothetical protein
MPLKDPEALKAYKKRYYEGRKAFVLAQCKKYREANKDAIVARQREWNDENRERVRGYKQAWAERNPGSKREYAARPEVKVRQQERGRAHYEANKDKVKAQAKAWREANPERKRGADWAGHLRRSYGITLEQYDQMLRDQDGKCAICQRPEAESAGGKLAVDHMHCSGRVRSLLCRQCNSAIGMLREDPDIIYAAAQYVRKHQSH